MLTFGTESAAVSHTSYSPPKPGAEPNCVESGISDTLVREELDRVLSSHDFQASKLCQSFLRYVVENTLSGHADELKERTIGIEVFGKTPSYDPSEDAGVRVKAGEVRKRLRSYYSSQPLDAKVLIELPSGTYIPEFRSLKHEERPAAARSWVRSRPFWIATSTVVVVGMAMALFFWLRPHPVPDSVDPFWAPVFQSHKAVFVCTVPVPVYSDIRNLGSEPPARFEDFVLVPNRFVAVSDINSATQIAEMFGRMGEPYKLRIGNEVSFRDLRTTPAVLVGFSYTQWHEIGEHFRYSIDLSRRPFGISQDGALTSWTIKTHPDDPELSEDYAIVSRVFYPGTNSIIVEITGISHYGTEAAADLVTNPSLLQQTLRGLPTGWQQKNVQIVLHVDVISGSPAVPSVIATHVW